MKILYGLSGDGFGHSSRARTILPYLEKNGHDVKIMTYGQGLDVLKKYDVFPIEGMKIEFKDGKLKKRKTIKNSFIKFSSNIKKNKDIHELMKNNFDLIISDMEPLTAILSFWHQLPLLCLDNQHRLTNLKLNVPRRYKKDYYIAKYVTKTFVSKADWYVITSFSNGIFKNKYKKNSFIIPPIIRDKVKSLKPSEGENVLIYLTRKDENIISELKKINQKFVIYGWDIEKKSDNLTFHKAGDKFLKDLASCKAIIATAGFSLMSEAIYLKKPYLALPLEGQFEQVLNALFLKKSGFGNYSESINSKIIEKFLKKRNTYAKKLLEFNPDYDLLYKILDKILNKKT